MRFGAGSGRSIPCMGANSIVTYSPSASPAASARCLSWSCRATGNRMLAEWRTPHRAGLPPRFTGLGDDGLSLMVAILAPVLEYETATRRVRSNQLARCSGATAPDSPEFCSRDGASRRLAAMCRKDSSDNTRPVSL